MDRLYNLSALAEIKHAERNCDIAVMYLIRNKYISYERRMFLNQIFVDYIELLQTPIGKHYAKLRLALTEPHV